MSTPLTLPEISALATLPDEAITRILDLLFEPSKELHALSLPAIRAACSPSAPTPLASYDGLVDIVRAELLALQSQVATHSEPSPTQARLGAKHQLLAILGAHPRLGAKKVESAQSAAEQAQLQQASVEEAAKLAALNAEYESSFPGLIYVVFVNGRSRDVIMQNMRERIERGIYALEEVEAIEAMAAIAKDRAAKLLQASG
ncbi:hypothetical protein SCUCBS95973_008142 [Sporothrix curviconia]|uniref:Oxo-4-hydroxy-4-carboxy-5-ureidoimidazoline decarboxylase domain-containing protein n=1 Tax=Sporothrix curviconia TaxID=1260050 RepID=A0ABP0CJ45_9PEZI